MKSAFERAMERFGGEVRTFSEEQRRQMAEIDKRLDAKIAQARFEADQRLQKAAEDAEKQDQIRDELVTEVASLNRRREVEKEKVRQQST